MSRAVTVADVRRAEADLEQAVWALGQFLEMCWEVAGVEGATPWLITLCPLIKAATESNARLQKTRSRLARRG